MKGPGPAEQEPAPARSQYRQQAGSPPKLVPLQQGGELALQLPRPPPLLPGTSLPLHPTALQAPPLTRGGRSSVPSSLCRRLDELIFSSSF